MVLRHTNESLPLPPEDLRRMVGQANPAMYDNPSREPVFGEMDFLGLPPDSLYRFVYDFGCGCGRQARQLMLQDPPVGSFIGVDISKPLVDWCARNLTARDSRYQFYHHDVHSVTYAPDNSPARTAELPGPDGEITLFNAHSVFTHLHYDQAAFYLGQARRLLTDDGVIRSTWLFIDKRVFPQMHGGLHCVYIQENDPTQAVFYDWRDAFELFESLGFVILDIKWTEQYGKPNTIVLGQASRYADRRRDAQQHLSSPPSTIVGSDADLELLAGHNSGWRAKRGDELVTRLEAFPGVSSAEVDPANYLVTVVMDDSVDESSVAAVAKGFGFRLSRGQ